MKYYIDLYGCAKNQVDAENMMESLNSSGYTNTDNAEEADLIIVNSCGFIESAKKESINAVLSWRKFYPKKKIFLAGCLAERYGNDLSESLPEADGIYGINGITGIAEIRGKAGGNRPLLSMPGTAYVKISEGCSNNCSYCAIPLIRGALKSRKMEEIISECRTLLKRGIKELCLIAQDTASYGRDLSPPIGLQHAGLMSAGLPELLSAISALEGDFRVRLLYIHPDHFPMEILDVMEKDKRILPYFDIPFQHASQKILGAMNRKGNAKIYLGLIRAIRKRLPDAVIRSTFMTGFPGETEEDFLELLDFQKKAKLSWLGIFTYSREENTLSYNMKERVPKKTALQRKRLLEENQIRITETQMDKFIGKTEIVLTEEKMEAPGGADGGGDGETLLYLGRLSCHAPEVDGSAVIFSDRELELGSLIPCRVIGRANFDLKVRLGYLNVEG